MRGRGKTISNTSEQMEGLDTRGHPDGACKKRQITEIIKISSSNHGSSRRNIDKEGIRSQGSNPEAFHETKEALWNEVAWLKSEVKDLKSENKDLKQTVNNLAVIVINNNMNFFSHSFYDTKESPKAMISEFSLTEPKDLQEQNNGFDCGVWVAHWMSECTKNNNYNKISVGVFFWCKYF